MIRTRRSSAGLLRAHDIDHDLIVFPDDVHDSLLHKRWIYTFERTGEFLGRYIGTPRRTTTAVSRPSTPLGSS
ncbi:MAG TPA: hypothetical protein VMO26_15030 [Vicinamibacterales bacterium]|nr:hypothetical protein [Vicinamibacterales bacterium]